MRKKDAIRTANVSSDEKALFLVFEESKAKQSTARRDVNIAEVEVGKAGEKPEEISAARRKLKDLKDTASKADLDRKNAEIAWSNERNKNEPTQVRKFRSEIIRSQSVMQVFDPWFMDGNTHDSVMATSNLQQDENEKLHANYLHITIFEPKIL